MNRILMTFLISISIVPMLPAQSHYALTFTAASNTCVRVLHTDTLAPESAVTVEAWINAISLSGSPSIISKTEVGGYALYGAGGFLRFDVRLNGFYQTVSFDGTGLTGTWHHVAGTSDGRYTRLYVDGMLKHTVDAGGVYPIQYLYENALIIGGEASSGTSPGGSYFNGSVDEARIWNTARTYGEINASMNTPLTGNESGLVGYWNFDEGAGTSANDRTPYNQDGTLLNSPAWSSSGAALPVELVSFTATGTASGTVMKWRTATETDNYGFEIQRSADGSRPLNAESRKWKNVGFVEGNGNSSIVHEYSFTDRVLSAGEYLYRLKQIDRDGKFSYSHEVDVFVGMAPAILALEQNYPNPFNPTTDISCQLSAVSQTKLAIYDVAGREIAILVNEMKSPGTYSVQWNASRFTSGTYFVKLQSGSGVHMRKMMLLK